MTVSARTARLAALSAPRYVQLTGYAQAANVTLATLESRAQLVVPVVAMVGGSVVQGMNSRGPEYVPPEVLANFPESFNGRPIVPVHPYNGTGSANDPHTQNKYRFGQVFNARFDDADGNLKLDAWLDIERAKTLGGDPESVVADCQAGKLVEVSLGAWIVMAEEEGETEDGRSYSYVWQYITSYDHLAMGLAGLEGACSCEMGCGAPRLNTAAAQAADKEGAPNMPTSAPVLRSNALAKARRPTFNGTETTTWSSPSWHEWVTALHTGSESPKSIADATDALKAAIARHTLLGDPNADNLRDLTLFPVVNPHSGKLNERALRAVIGGRGSQADIPDAAKSSAQEMASSLLKSEFDVEFKDEESTAKESANMAEPKPKPDRATAPAAPDRSPKLLARMFGAFASIFRANGGSTDGVSDSELRAALWNALRASEPAFGWGPYYSWGSSYDAIIDVYYTENTVIYVTCPYDDVIYWRQTYTVDAQGNVTLSGDREMVTPDYNWKPVAASASSDAENENADPDPEMPDVPVGGMTAAANVAPACSCNKTTSPATLSTPATDAPAAVTTSPTPTSTEGDSAPMAATVVTPAVKTLVARLVANSGGVFTAEQIPQLEAFPEAQLAAMCEKFAPQPASATPVSATPAVTPATATSAANSAEPPTAPAANAAPAIPNPTASPTAASPEPESFEAFLARSPAEFQAFYAQQKATMDARRASLLAAIGAKSKATAAMLTTAPVGIEQLEAVAHDLGCFTPAPIPSYGAAGLPVPPAASANATPSYRPPKIFDMALHAMGKPGVGEIGPPSGTTSAKPN